MRQISAAAVDNPRPFRPSAGDIVRHVDYPQWGRGYVIRARKAGLDVFFRWGGKRRIAAGDPVEPSTASGLEAELFALCASLSASAWSRGHHSVYAIELDRAVWKDRAFRERNPGGAAGDCVYIGVTGLTPERRFERHRAGTQSARLVRAHGVRLRLDLVEGFARLPYRVAAQMEPKLAAWLRAQGFAVWQN
jgi:predicted GIY-YIG superfamily endonuclease